MLQEEMLPRQAPAGAKVLDSFFDEGKRLWKINPKFVRSRQFYELWETSANPLPFAIGPEGVVLAGKTVRPPEKDLSAGVYFQWNSELNCASAVVEGRAGRVCVYPFGFDANGMPELGNPVEKEISGESNAADAGFFDVIFSIKAKFPDIDFENIRRTHFHKILDSMKGSSPISVLAALKRLKAEEIRQLFRRTLADRASDELTNQLELPLFGTYSRTTTAESAEITGNTAPREADTLWKVGRLLEVLSETSAQMIEHERKFVLSFVSAEIFTINERGAIIRLKPEPGSPLAQEDILILRSSPDGSKAGTFHADFFDRNQVIGRLIPEAGFTLTEEKLHQLEGTLLRGPSELFHQRLEDIRASVQKNGKTPELFGAGAAFLGMIPLTFHFQEEHAPDELDSSQKTAFGTAVSPENPLVLIQGPPGTGKTHVLESIVRYLYSTGKRILITAPSHTAVDNICRRITDLPFLRCGGYMESISPEIAEHHWSGNREIVRDIRKAGNGRVPIFAGTHAAILKDTVIRFDAETDGLFDVIIFDESGMSAFEEVLLCSVYAKRAVLIGDHKQLPPFPKPEPVIKAVEQKANFLEGPLRTILTRSMMEYLIKERQIPSVRLRTSYRCRNPRLLRFISGAFYQAGILPDTATDYYKMPYPVREDKYPRTTLMWISTSGEDAKRRSEQIVFQKQGKGAPARPGICNRLEAALCVRAVESLLGKYDLEEISVISPYRMQIKLLRNALGTALAGRFAEDRLQTFLYSRIATVDSFQGDESDAVVISYVRSGNGIGFTDDLNRINVALTRCRCELIAAGDLECLKKYGKQHIFDLLERAFLRDGVIVPAAAFVKAEEPLPEIPKSVPYLPEA